MAASATARVGIRSLKVPSVGELVPVPDPNVELKEQLRQLQLTVEGCDGQLSGVEAQLGDLHRQVQQEQLASSSSNKAEGAGVASAGSAVPALKAALMTTQQRAREQVAELQGASGRLGEMQRAQVPRGGGTDKELRVRKTWRARQFWMGRLL